MFPVYGSYDAMAQNLKRPVSLPFLNNVPTYFILMLIATDQCNTEHSSHNSQVIILEHATYRSSFSANTCS